MSSVIEVEDDSSDQLKGRAGGAGGAGGAGRAGRRGERGARAGAGAEAAWYFQRRSGGWERFDPALEKAVEDAWTKDQASVQLCHYNFDLRLQESMQQENMQTKRKRKIKREGGPKQSAASKQLADRPGVEEAEAVAGEIRWLRSWCKLSISVATVCGCLRTRSKSKVHSNEAATLNGR